jgi:hypothetical protein
MYVDVSKRDVATQILPRVIDEELLSHSGVKGSMTIGVPYDAFGRDQFNERPVSLVTVQPGVTELMLMEHLSTRLSPHWWPRLCSWNPCQPAPLESCRQIERCSST